MIILTTIDLKTCTCIINMTDTFILFHWKYVTLTALIKCALKEILQNATTGLKKRGGVQILNGHNLLVFIPKYFFWCSYYDLEVRIPLKIYKKGINIYINMKGTSIYNDKCISVSLWILLYHINFHLDLYHEMMISTDKTHERIGTTAVLASPELVLRMAALRVPATVTLSCSSRWKPSTLSWRRFSWSRRLPSCTSWGGGTTPTMLFSRSCTSVLLKKTCVPLVSSKCIWMVE